MNIEVLVKKKMVYLTAVRDHQLAVIQVLMVV